jgi:serine/threonine protein kinase
MGDVYAGYDEKLGRRVALKAIRSEHRLNAEAKARFLREDPRRPRPPTTARP